jgi:hypothetical protein
MAGISVEAADLSATIRDPRLRYRDIGWRGSRQSFDDGCGASHEG